MHSWTGAERLMRREAGLNVARLGGRQALPLVIAVGQLRPQAVIALGGVDTEDPARTLSDVALLAATFRPTRAQVAVVIPATESRGRGLLLCREAEVVPDGLVELTRVWGWRRFGRRVLWLPVEGHTWYPGPALLDRIATAILTRRDLDWHPEDQEQLLALTLAAGHRVHLARPT